MNGITMNYGTAWLDRTSSGVLMVCDAYTLGGQKYDIIVEGLPAPEVSGGSDAERAQYVQNLIVKIQNLWLTNVEAVQRTQPAHASQLVFDYYKNEDPKQASRTEVKMLGMQENSQSPALMLINSGDAFELPATIDENLVKSTVRRKEWMNNTQRTIPRTVNDAMQALFNGLSSHVILSSNAASSPAAPAPTTSQLTRMKVDIDKLVGAAKKAGATIKGLAKQVLDKIWPNDSKDPVIPESIDNTDGDAAIMQYVENLDPLLQDAAKEYLIALRDKARKK